ncbi:Carbamoyltransferase [Magnetococcus marinus MC-1]|uniref:Carbamoyltransferase n=1 Tax=Magnetococcus marinus (strain ATCC BAA-1437 / JCM 17883 / MC-1) TaxID=156889 RepID=A0L589_MAGMM|nr:carbamoyltransferase C-terminal domain-containing protein [Magnetococcus marinus]ABK43132.1 Carbamoyltransferase [Magnetococcus marinus MC-1]
MFVLGLNGGLGHDPSVCLMRDHEILFMAEEERYTRQKHARHQAPIHATAAALQHAGITMNDVDYIAASWMLNPTNQGALEGLLKSKSFLGLRVPKIVQSEHHLAHAMSAYFSSGYDDAAILVVDGSDAEGFSTSIYKASGYHVEKIQSFPVHDSLGHFYDAATRYLGMKNGNEGKTMGLACYGEVIDPIEPLEITEDGYQVNLSNLFPDDNDDFGTIKMWFAWFEHQFGASPYTRPEFNHNASQFHYEINFTQHQKNVAASVQRALERVLLNLAKQALHKSGSRNLVLSGGVALNCSANGFLLAQGIADSIYLMPASHDAGTALGSAQYCYQLYHPNPQKFQPLRSAALGSRFTNDDVAATLKRYNIKAKRCDDIAATTAKSLAEDKVVGWFQGAMEVGPRALGQRSILANPSRQGMLDHVNHIKGRETWRPLAPSMQREHAADYLEIADFEPFMLNARQVKQEMRNEIAAVTHVDNSCRPQMVDKQTHGRYWHMLEHLKGYTGHPVTMNTSFNLRGQPIVCTPTEAIQTFYSSGLDCLALEDFLLEK